MTDPLSEAVLANASPDELAKCPTPTSTMGVCVRKSEEKMFEGLQPNDIDLKTSLHLEEVPLPELAPDEVLIAVMASAINYNTVWSAMFLPVPTFRFLERFGAESTSGARHDIDRHVLGSDASGVVVRVGADVRHYKVGAHVVIGTLHTDEQDPIAQQDGMLPGTQRAWGFETNYGGLAHYAIVKATQLLPKPAHLSWEESACTTLCLMTAYRMLISRNGSCVKLGDLVLIWGATGGLGAFATQLAKAAGCRVVGVVGNESKVALAQELGCDLVIDRSRLTQVDERGLASSAGVRWVGQQIREHFGEDPHHVFEHVGRDTFGASVVLARRGGSIVTCGSSTGYRHEFDNRHLWMKLKRIIGSHGANYQEAWEANELVRRGVIFPTLSKTFDLADTATAASRVHANQHVGKLGVLCLAPKPGLGITDEAFRSSLPADRLDLFSS